MFSPGCGARRCFSLTGTSPPLPFSSSSSVWFCCSSFWFSYAAVAAAASVTKSPNDRKWASTTWHCSRKSSRLASSIFTIPFKILFFKKKKNVFTVLNCHILLMNILSVRE
ncbi:hypothetical protein PDJAM_G00048270 [Pangasius djambal]|uniref:Uncharacterized protein n=1 Tax=Pangasius djambal TaxID=1691987 RepID=A0ACC5YVR2_9TELE|nr:hypothetical protein [Pangasius djambal]